LPEASLLQRVIRNSVALATGRALVALTRLVIAGIIVRMAGAEAFGEYALLFGILAISEWATDFGTTEISVREIRRAPECGIARLRVLTLAKVVQIPLACALLLLLLIALQYPERIVEAGLVAAVSLVFVAGISIYRTLFKSDLTMEQEMMAELASVLVMVPLIAIAIRNGGGLVALMGCHVISRAVFFGLCHRFGRNRFLIDWRGVQRAEVRELFVEALPIGVMGLLVGLYESLDILVLSKMGNSTQLAYYTAAQRLLWPALLTLGSIATTLYPVVAGMWPHSPVRFARACQTGLEVVLILAGLATCVAFAGAEFLIGLLGPQLVGGAEVMQVLALLIFVKAFATTIGPILYVVHAQKHALLLISCALLAKACAIAAVVTPFGYLGIAAAAVTVEMCFAALPAIWLLQRSSSWRCDWRVPLKALVATIAAALAARTLAPDSSLLAGLVAAVLYVGLVWVSGAAAPARIRALLAGNQS
jgi:O-antigen/teichoic acid export membrane protein